MLFRSVRRSPSPLPAPAGWTEGWLRTGPLDNAVLDALAFGPEIQVVSPPELRRALHEKALRIARLHAPLTDVDVAGRALMGEIDSGP